MWRFGVVEYRGLKFCVYDLLPPPVRSQKIIRIEYHYTPPYACTGADGCGRVGGGCGAWVRCVGAWYSTIKNNTKKFFQKNKKTCKKYAKNS